VDDRTFIDTSGFVYVEDGDAPDEQTVARHETRQLDTDDRGVVSTQVYTVRVLSGHSHAVMEAWRGGLVTDSRAVGLLHGTRPR
jgi:hypothetical protein